MSITRSILSGTVNRSLRHRPIPDLKLVIDRSKSISESLQIVQTSLQSTVRCPKQQGWTKEALHDKFTGFTINEDNHARILGIITALREIESNVLSTASEEEINRVITAVNDVGRRLIVVGWDKPTIERMMVETKAATDSPL